MKLEKGKILIYGYGNPGRQDDGLGNLFVEEMQKWAEENNLDYLDFDSNYQLNIEDSERISDKEIVIFADASVEKIEEYCLTKVFPEPNQIEFTMHAVSPAFIAKLTNDLFKKMPAIYLMHLKGYEFDFKEGISENASKNLNNALNLLKLLLSVNDLSKVFFNLERACLTLNCYN